MINAATQALLQEQVVRLRELSPQLGITDIRHEGLTVVVSFRRRRDGKVFTLRFGCDGWPVVPPSTHFVDPTTGEDRGPEVWPTDGEQAFKTTAQPRFICLPGIREYHERHGPIQPNIHSNALPAILHQVLQCIEARG
jgi:hypothetical protein